MRLYSPETAPELPAGMTSMMMPSELDLLYSIAKTYCSGQGDIVDAGLFLGASTACFSEGLAANDRLGEAAAPVRIHSYERAIVTKPMLAAIRRNAPGLASQLGEDGASYAGYLTDLLSKYPNVELTIGDIMDAEGPSRDIEILFLDILKNPQIQDKCLDMFFRKLIPNRSLVIQQDYFWYLGWFVNAYMEKYRDYFEMIDACETSAVFLLKKDLPDHAFETQTFGGAHRYETLELLEGARHQGETDSQVLMQELCVIGFVLQEMGALYAEMKLHKFVITHGDLMLGQSHRPDIRRATRAYAEMRRRILNTMTNPKLRKILLDL
jgi:hypothetical protein